MIDEENSEQKILPAVLSVYHRAECPRLLPFIEVFENHLYGDRKHDGNDEAL